MVKFYLTTCNSRRKPSICKFKCRSVCLTCVTKSQHESIVQTESSSNRTICVEAYIGEFLFTITFQQTAKPNRLRSHDKLIRYTDDLFKITLQHTGKFDWRMPLFSHCCAMF